MDESSNLSSTVVLRLWKYFPRASVVDASCTGPDGDLPFAEHTSRRAAIVRCGVGLRREGPTTEHFGHSEVRRITRAHGHGLGIRAQSASSRAAAGPQVRYLSSLSIIVAVVRRDTDTDPRRLVRGRQSGSQESTTSRAPVANLEMFLLVIYLYVCGELRCAGAPKKPFNQAIGSQGIGAGAARRRDGLTQDWRVERRGGARDLTTSLRINFMFVVARMNVRRRRQLRAVG
jgi:hypothetical protein